MPGARYESSVRIDLSAHFFSEPFSKIDASSSLNLFCWCPVQLFHGVWAFKFESFCLLRRERETQLGFRLYMYLYYIYIYTHMWYLTWLARALYIVQHHCFISTLACVPSKAKSQQEICCYCMGNRKHAQKQWDPQLLFPGAGSWSMEFRENFKSLTLTSGWHRPPAAWMPTARSGLQTAVNSVKASHHKCHKKPHV